MKSKKSCLLLNELASLTNIERSKFSLTLLFGYFGLLYEKKLFGAIYKNEIYLKSNPKLFCLLDKDNINLNNFEFLTLQQGIFNKKLNYFKIPSLIFNNKSLLTKLFNLAIETHEQKTSVKNNSAKKIRTLPNISFSLERSLYKIGIKDADDLSNIGIFEVFYELEKINKDISKSILFHLHCALLETNSLCLKADEKEIILKQYQNIKNQKNNNF